MLQQVQNWFDALIMCLSLPMSGPACRPLWETVMYASAALGLALSLWAGWKIASNWMAQATERRAEEERQRETEERIKRDLRWIDDRDVAKEITDPKLQETLRRELKLRRRRNLHDSDDGDK